MIANAKKTALFCLGVAYQKFMTELEKQQEVLAGITDVVMNAFAMESVMLRARKMAGSGKSAEDATRDGCGSSCARRWSGSKARRGTVLAACSEGDALRMNLAVLRRFTKYEPVNAIALRRKIAGRLLESGKYIV